MSENYKYKMIKNLVDDNGNKKTAALKLNCSIRTINRLIISYKTYGKCAFIHGNHGRKPSTTIDSQIKEEVISLYKNSFLDTNFTHFCEILERIYSISISDTILNRWLREELIVSPKAHRATKKKMKNKIKNLTKLTQSKKDKQLLIEATENILSSDPHPRRPRFSHFGEQIQMDASSFIWFGDTPTHLHLAIDDATGSVVGAYLDTQETLNAYYHVLYQILIDYGIPYSFYTDRRTVFEYKKINAPSDEDDSFTQFGYACKNLGIIVNTTSVAQAKGRVERLNQTFQSRLPVELRIHNIFTIEDANLFLNSYIKEYNQQFALPIHPTKNVFETTY